MILATRLPVLALIAFAATAAPEILFNGDKFSVAREGELSGFAKTRALAEQGDAVAQNAMGDDCARKRQFADAVIWYRQSAAQGHLDAQTSLGDLLVFGGAIGQIAGKDIPNGVRWLQLAAHRGSPSAQLQLHRCYADGIGVPKDDVEAYKWAIIEMRHRTIQISNYKEAIERRLTTAEAKEGVRRAAAFQVDPNAQLPSAPPTVLDLNQFKLAGISGSSTRRVALINDEVFAVGDRRTLKTKSGTIDLTCIEIKDGAVVVQAGTNGPLGELRLGGQQ